MIHRGAIHWVGTAFGVFTAVVGIVDIATDLLVCVQYWQQGIWIAFGFSLGILIIADVLYATITIECGLLGNMHLFGRLGSHLRQHFKEKCPNRLWLYCVVLPIAQLALPIDWVLSTFWKDTQTAESDVEGDAERPTLLVDSLYATVQWHWKTYILFYVETAAESLPQSILQIIVMTIQDEVTVLQIISIILSLVAIGSKAITLSQSFDMKLFFLKLCCLLFDLVLIFFSVSSLFTLPNANASQCTVIFWGSTDLSMYACVWLWMALAVWGLWPILGLFGGIGGALSEYRDSGNAKKMWEWLLLAVPFLLCGFLLPLPRASILVAWLMIFKESDSDLPKDDMHKRAFLAQLYKFVCANREFWYLKQRKVEAFLSCCFEEQHKRKPQLCKSCISSCHQTRQRSLPCQMGLAPAGPVPEFDRETIPAQVLLKEACTTTLDLPEDAAYEMYHCLSCKLYLCDHCAKTCHWWHSIQYLGVCSAQCNTKSTCLAIQENQKIQAGVLQATEGTVSSGKKELPGALDWLSRFAEAAAFTIGAVFVFAMGCHVVYGVLYPVLVVALQVHPFSGFHYFCLATLAFLVLAIATLAVLALPTYLSFLDDFDFSAYGCRHSVFRLQSFPTIKEVAKACYVPTPEQILLSCLPPRMVCSDLAGVILEFLDSSALPFAPSNSLLRTSIVLFPGRSRQGILCPPQQSLSSPPDQLKEDYLFPPLTVLCPPSSPASVAPAGLPSDASDPFDCVITIPDDIAMPFSEI